MTYELVDGNALAGIFTELLSRDATMIQAECGACGATAPLATTTVERDEFAVIVRCRGCTHTLLTILNDPAGSRLVIGAVRNLVL
ncbi:DUF6510 family protein [Microbacterium sp. RU33B]|uniref:DUF6510 family protein n=1 Tax=Microbacterium sp. RU33B TaxID=1907390 RepID=UPI0009677E6A|nr:DUF6510 family protein [Microbacterium sp. RU33B]SIT75688.1 hypothetical protein SAMN05880545_1494 [Microbacterium sp. RU33B]